MPVRIYEIAKIVGVESKAVLVKAKELGIPTAKSPSSSLDKITAEYLVEQMGGSIDAASLPKPEVKAGAKKKTTKVKAKKTLAKKTTKKATDLKTEAPKKAAKTATKSKAKTKTKSETAVPKLDPAPLEPEETTVAEIVSDPTAVESPIADPEPISEPESDPEQATDSSEKKETATASPSEPEEADTPTVEAKEESQRAVEESADEKTSQGSSQTEVKSDEPPFQVEPAGPKVGDKIGFINLSPGAVTRSDRDRGANSKSKPRAPRKGERQQSVTAKSGRLDPKDNRRKPGIGLRSESSKGSGNSATASVSKKAKPKFTEPTSGDIITLKPPIIVRDLAGKLNRKPFQLIADLMEMGVFANVNQTIEEDIAKQVCAKYRRRFDLEKRERGAGVIKPQDKPVTLDFEDKEEDLRARAPVVTIMGHVDHGKTTLLDSIRNSNVVAKEAGGITQHIGAYTINVPHPDNPKKLKQITFLDTPGHAAFSAMRARGANITDIVILVVAATEGVMPQTIEALNHAKQAQVPIIVAVNKCDHPNANPMQTRQQLQEHEIVCEEWGGHTIFQDLSALSGEGVDKLLDLLLLQAEIMELKANPNRTAIGNIVESGIEPGGPTATVLVRKGTLKTGDAVICGPFYGKVRALITEEGKRISEAGPSVAVKLLGLNGTPNSGLEFNAVKNEKEARALAQEREENNRLKEVESRKKVTLENLFDTLSSNAAKLLKVIVKADTQGSAEAIVDSLNEIESEKVSIEIIHNAVGTVTNSDVLLASASTAIVIGFHTRLDKGVAKVAKQEGVQIKLYSIIYELVEEVKDAMAGLLDPLSNEVPTGKVEIRQVFELTKGSKVAGCMVTSGKFAKGKVRVLRNKEIIFKGTTQSVRHFQDEVNEVRSGFECGIRIDGFDKFKEGDEIESFKIEKVPQGL